MKMMKLTEKKLRQIIREEQEKLQEVRFGTKEGLEGVAFYKERLRLLREAQGHLEEAMGALGDVSILDIDSAVGEEDEDVRSASEDILAASEFLEGIIMATEAMVDMGSR